MPLGLCLLILPCGADNLPYQKARIYWTRLVPGAPH